MNGGGEGLQRETDLTLGEKVVDVNLQKVHCEGAPPLTEALCEVPTIVRQGLPNLRKSRGPSSQTGIHSRDALK